MALRAGDKAPPFQLPSTTGEDVSLASLHGRKVVLFFYPKDETPGCTREACDFRDLNDAITEAGAAVYGISKDSLASHERFQKNHELPYPLLTDADNAVATEYGAYGTKTMYGKKVTGTIRSTFLIDENGVIAAVWSPVKVEGHAEKVLVALTGGGDAGSKKAAAAKAASVKKAAPRTLGGKNKPGGPPRSSVPRRAAQRGR